MKHEEKAARLLRPDRASTQTGNDERKRLRNESYAKARQISGVKRAEADGRSRQATEVALPHRRLAEDLPVANYC
jgi:hypothetical protein